MNSLAIATSEHKVIPFIIAAVAISITVGLQEVATHLQVSLPLWLPLPSAFAIYGGLFAGFEGRFWRWPFLRKLGLVRVPDLKGEWMSTTSSSVDNFSKEFLGPVTISQTWSRLHVFFDGTDAFSHSQSVSITFLGPSRISLVYVYMSEKRPQFSDEEYLHFGTARLIGVLNDDGTATSLEGSYFTDKGRNTYGRIKLERK